MIARLWHGWTTPEDADTYERLLKTEIFPGILARNVPGFRRIELLRRPLGPQVEFVTVMWFDAIEDVRGFAGADFEVAVVPQKARAMLAHFDEHSHHYEVREAQELRA